MKNKIIIAIMIFLLSISLLSSDSPNEKKVYFSYHGNASAGVTSYWFKNTEYILIDGFGDGNVRVINKTKEDLEIELLRLQIKELKSNYGNK